MLETGEIFRRFRLPCRDGRDAWHINCIGDWDERLVLAAFGQFDSHRDWYAKSNGNGFVFDLATGERLWQGLSQPHSPRMSPGGQRIVCDSVNAQLLIDEGQGVIRSIKFPETYPRGLAFDAHFIYVGLSVEYKKRRGPASIAILDRFDYSEVMRVQLPCWQVYEILAVSSDVIDWMRKHRTSRLEIWREMTTRSIKNNALFYISRIKDKCKKLKTENRSTDSATIALA